MSMINHNMKHALHINEMRVEINSTFFFVCVCGEHEKQSEKLKDERTLWTLAKVKLKRLSISQQQFLNS